MPPSLLGLEGKGLLGGVEVAQLLASDVAEERVKDMHRLTKFCSNACVPCRHFIHGFNVLNLCQNSIKALTLGKDGFGSYGHSLCLFFVNTVIAIIEDQGWKKYSEDTIDVFSLYSLPQYFHSKSPPKYLHHCLMKISTSILKSGDFEYLRLIWWLIFMSSGNYPAFKGKQII